MVDENGFLPNYGANDGALFFRLSSADYRDYRPQLQALAAALGTELLFNTSNEDSHWYGIFENARKTWQPPNGIHTFPNGGYYIIREPRTLTFIKCGSYKDRPSQADNLHLDIWYQGENILPDAGSYKYNTDDATIRYFSGTESHNTVMLDSNDQMLKGGRFIWYHWSQSLKAEVSEDTARFIFEGEVSAFIYIDKGIVHKRTVVKQKWLPVWEVTDEIVNAPAGLKMRQLWHVLSATGNRVRITAKNTAGADLKGQKQDGWYSSLYGQKEKDNQYCFTSDNNIISTTIKVV